MCQYYLSLDPPASGTLLGRTTAMLLISTVLALSLMQAEQVQPAADPQPPDPQPQAAQQKAPPTPPRTGIRALFHNLVEDVQKLPSMQNLYLAGIGGGLALAVHPADQSVNAHLMSNYDAVNTLFAPGKYIGDTPEQVAFSLGTYAVGRFYDQPRTSHL